MVTDRKEIERIANEYAQSKELNIENVLKIISEQIKKNIPHGDKRFRLFNQEFNKKFQKGSAQRGAAEALTWGILNVPLNLFFLGQNAAVLIELHGFLERFVLIEVPKLLGKDDLSRSLIDDLIRRKTLNELWDVLVVLKRWDEEDIKYISKLANIRNGIAHKNAKLISRHLGDGRDLATSEIDKLLNKTDCIPYILRVIELLIKATGVI